MAINLNLTEEQQLIQDTAREFFADKCPLSVVREYENAADEFPRALWKEMAELGWLGMPFAEQYGGTGSAFLDMYGLYVELGRQLVPVPHLETVALAGQVIAALGSDEQKNRILGGIASGDVIVSPALMEPEGVYGPAGIQLSARRDGAGYVLDGTKVLVPYVASADSILVAARTSGSDGEEGVSLFLVEPSAGGVSSERLENTAGYPLHAVTFQSVQVTDEAVVGTVGKSWATLHDVMMKAAVLQSAMVVGAGHKILDFTADYAKIREQFGTPIGKHQAVQYLCTDIAIHGHLTKLLTLQAGWKIDSGQSFHREAALAKASASRAAAAMTFASHEVHAGIGFMLEHDLQLYTRRGKHWEFNLGDERYHLEQAMAASGI